MSSRTNGTGAPGAGGSNAAGGGVSNAGGGGNDSSRNRRHSLSTSEAQPSRHLLPPPSGGPPVGGAQPPSSPSASRGGGVAHHAEMHSSSIGVAAAAAIHHAKIMTSNPSYGPGAGGVLGRATNGLYNGVKSSLENKNSDYNCPICFELLQEAHVTKCGHTFCHECIVKSLQLSSRCPKCNFHLEKPLEAIFPNFAINELVSKYRSRAQAINDHLQKPHFEGLRTALVDNGALLGMADVDYMLRFLAQRKEEIESESFLTQQLLLKDFLLHLKRQKDDQLYQLQKEGAVINGDLDKVKAAIDEFTSDNFVGQQLFHLDESSSNSGSSSPQPPTSKRFKPDGVVPSLQEQQQQLTVLTAPFGHALGQRKQRMHAHFDDLTHCYFSTRANDMLFPSAMKRSADEVPPMEDEGTSGATAAPEATEVSKVVQGQMGRVGTLDSFSNCLSKFTRYNSVRPLATLSYTSDMFSNASIVSSIEFDKDNEFFAIAGVTKRIKIYDYNVVIKDVVDVHYPTTEMMCTSKISCVAWSYFYKNNLVSSDYEGTVTVWDTNTVEKVKVFQEHEKRCWSVDYNLVDTKLIASGSDDARVKLWSTNVNHSVASLEAKANICCVKFNPSSCYHLAFGSADHCVHYYDLRNTKSALRVFKGHKKAVSYVKFLNGTDLVSASTDSQLKLWNVNSDSCRRSFQGHVNEKNFVGLATDGDYITCGSENNSLYVYYKGLSKPLFSYKFDVIKGFFEREQHHRNTRDEEGNEFVSAVCWRRNTNVLVGANSQGTIKVLEMV